MRAYEHLCVSVYHAIMDLSFIYIAYKIVDIFSFDCIYATIL